ncbi:hypothetical protein CUMW_151080, partial [Citrus unshiu]
FLYVVIFIMDKGKNVPEISSPEQSNAHFDEFLDEQNYGFVGEESEYHEALIVEGYDPKTPLADHVPDLDEFGDGNEDEPESSSKRSRGGTVGLGVLVGEEAIELATYIGVLARTSIPILYNDWRRVPDDTKERLWESVKKVSGVNKLRRVQNKFNHRLSRKGFTEEEVDRSVLWKRARQMKNGGYHPDVEPDKLEMKAKKGKMQSSGKNDILAQSLGKAPKCGHMQGVGKFVTSSLYFQTCQSPADRDRQKEDRLWRESINRQLEEMRNELRKTPRHSDIASSSYPCMPGENNNVVGDDDIESPLKLKQVSFDTVNYFQPDHLKKKKQGTPKNTIEQHNDIIEIGHTDAVKQTKDEGKKVAVKLLPTRRNTRHAGGVQRNKIPLLQLFGTMCEAKMSDQEWIPYLLDDGVFHLEGIRAHIGRRDCSAVLSMDAIGVNDVICFYSPWKNRSETIWIRSSRSGFTRRRT